MKPCLDCSHKDKCRIVCKAYSKWANDESPDLPILDKKPQEFNWLAKHRYAVSATCLKHPQALTVKIKSTGKPNKATGGHTKTTKPKRDKNGKFTKALKKEIN